MIQSRLESLVAEMVQKGITLEEAAREFERLFIACALREARGSKTEAARILGVHRNTLASKLRAPQQKPARRAPRRKHRKIS